MSVISTASYNKLERIGRGSYGEVFKARLRSNNMIVVVKEVSLVGLSPEEERDILNEGRVMLQVQHKHVVRFVASFVEKGMLHIIMEWASGGDLAQVNRAHSLSGNFFAEDKLWMYLIQLIQGMKHLHGKRILHRDIKPSNIFLDAQGNIKIGDLGLGKILSGTAQVTFSRNQIALAKKIVNEEPEIRMPSMYSKELQFIIGKMMEKNPRNRPSTDSLLNYSAVQIRIDRAHFQEREMELKKQVDEERSKAQLEKEEKIKMEQEMRQRMLDSETASVRHAEEMDNMRGELNRVKTEIGRLQERYNALEKRNSELAEMNEQRVKDAETNTKKIGDLEKWGRDLAKRELELLHSEAMLQTQLDKHKETVDVSTGPRNSPGSSPGTNSVVHVAIQTPPDFSQSRLVTPCAPAEAPANVSGSLAAPTPTHLFSTPAPDDEVRMKQPSPAPTPSTPMNHQPSSPASLSHPDQRKQGTPILDGYLRARSRTPSRSLGPPKRIVAPPNGFTELGTEDQDFNVAHPSNQHDSEILAAGRRASEQSSANPPPDHVPSSSHVTSQETSYAHVRHSLDSRDCALSAKSTVGKGGFSVVGDRGSRSPAVESFPPSGNRDSIRGPDHVDPYEPFEKATSRLFQRTSLANGTNFPPRSLPVRSSATDMTSLMQSRLHHGALRNQVKSQPEIAHDSTYAGCSPDVAYILAYTDRMRAQAQQALNATCASSSSGGSANSNKSISRTIELDESEPQPEVDLEGGTLSDGGGAGGVAQPRRKLTFTEGGADGRA